MFMSAISGLCVPDIVVTDLIYTFPGMGLAGRVFLTHCKSNQAVQALPAFLRLEEHLLSQMTEVAEDYGTICKASRMQ